MAAKVLRYSGLAVRYVARSVMRTVARLDPLAYLPPIEHAPGTRPVLGLVGYYGHGNYGDELFLEVFREHLGSEFDLRSILDPATWTLANRLGAGIREVDAILIGGGDIVVPWSTSARYWDRAYLRRPVFVAGVGVPDWRSPEGWAVRRLRSFFGHRNARFVGVRDAESAAWIAQHLRPQADIRIGPDLVCGLTLPVVQRPSGPPIFGVAVRSRREPDDLSNVRRLCLRAQELGYRVRRIVLATGRIRRADAIATAGLALPETELVETDDLDVISRAIGECSAMTSMKFHGVVVATMYGVPTIATMPTAKTRHFLRGIGRPDLLSVYSNPELPGFVSSEMQPISDEIRDRLRHDTVAHLAELRERIATTVGAVEPAAAHLGT